MRPQADDYPEHIERTIRAVLAEGIDTGAACLEPIAYPPREFPPRRGLPKKQMGRIFKRDHFMCRYCQGKTIFTPIMELLSVIFPDDFPFHPNWKAGVTHPAVASRSPAIDHLVPVVHGGTNEDKNLVTACTPCNSIKADFTLEQLGWEIQPITPTGWDGLMGLYRSLWEAAGTPKAKYHEGWMSALGV
jgi:5-methylcytosine-specific restriction endonuclease McrA